jgi:phage terminase small subunit
MKQPVSSTKRVKAGTSKNAAAVRRKAFAVAYTSNGRNGTQAAIAAGFSPKGADVTGSQLLGDPRVRSLVDEMTARAEQIGGLTADDAIRSNARVVNFDIRKLHRADGTPIPVHELDDDTALALSHQGSHGFVPNDRLRALDMAFKNLGLYEKDNRQKGKPIAIQMVFE